MRIVLALGWYFPESTGGTEVYVAALADAYARAGHDVTIVAPKAGLESPTEGVVGGHRVFRYPVPTSPTRAQARGDAAPPGVEALHRWIERQSPTIFHAHSLVTGLGVDQLEVARAVGAHVVYTNHLPSMGFACARGTLLRWGRTPCDGLRLARRCGACLLQQRGVPVAAAIMVTTVIPPALSRAARGWPGGVAAGLALPALIEHNGERQRRLVETVERVVVLSASAAAIWRSNGIDQRKLVINRLGVTAPPAISGHKRRKTALPIRIGYVGRYDWAKGLREMARAILRVSDTRLRFSFRGPTGSDAERRVHGELQAMLAADRRVVFEPGVAASQVIGALSELDLLCCPSTGYENGPTIALEALSAGTPIIGVSFGAFPENVSDGIEGRLVPPTDVMALANVFRSVAADASIVDSWRAGIRPVRTMTEVANDYLALYDEMSAREAE